MLRSDPMDHEPIVDHEQQLCVQQLEHGLEIFKSIKHYFSIWPISIDMYLSSV